MKEAKSLFLISFSVTDGGSEYTSYKVLFASNKREATARALQYAADYFCEGTVRDEEDPDLFTSEDGTRTIELEEVVKTTVDGLVKRLLIK
jgi:hypothetical protein